jgi:hypothetical protein
LLMWVPAEWVAVGMKGLPDTQVEIVVPDGGPLPASVADVEFYVPSFFPTPPVGEAMRHMERLRVVQALTAGVDKLRPYLPDVAVLCNARGAHDASTAEWVVAAMLAAIRRFPTFAMEQAAGRWSYQPTSELAEKTVLIVGYGSIGAAVERRLAGFEVTVRRVARSPRQGVAGLAELPALLPAAVYPGDRGHGGRCLPRAPERRRAAGQRRPWAGRRDRAAVCRAGERPAARRSRRDRPGAIAARPPAVDSARGVHHPARGGVHASVAAAGRPAGAGAGGGVPAR